MRARERRLKRIYNLHHFPFKRRKQFKELEITSTPSDFFERHQYSFIIWTSKTFDLRLFPDVLTNFLLQGEQL